MRVNTLFVDNSQKIKGIDIALHLQYNPNFY